MKIHEIENSGIYWTTAMVGRKLEYVAIDVSNYIGNIDKNAERKIRAGLRAIAGIIYWSRNTAAAVEHMEVFVSKTDCVTYKTREWLPRWYDDRRSVPVHYVEFI